MIFIKNIVKYSKLIGIFSLIELLIAFILGFFNLIGLSSSFSIIIIFILNILIFLISGYKMGKSTNKKGILEGTLTGLILIILLFISSLIIIHNNFSVGTIIYYLILICCSIIGSTIGKNKQISSKDE